MENTNKNLENFTSTGVTGLGDTNYDFSLHDQVDHDFFEADDEEEDDDDKPEVGSNNAFSSSIKTTAATPFSSQQDKNEEPQFQIDSFEESNCSNTSECQSYGPTIRLFPDLSDSSDSNNLSGSDEGEGALSEEGDQEYLENIVEKYCNYLDLGDSDYSDITEVSPLSSVNSSPLPSPMPMVDISNDNTSSNLVINTTTAAKETNIITTFDGQISKEGTANANANNQMASSSSNSNKSFGSEVSSLFVTEEPKSFSNNNNNNNDSYNERSPSCSSSSNLSNNNSTGGMLSGDGDGGCFGSSSSSVASFSSSSNSRKISSSSSSISSSARRNHSFNPEQVRKIDRENNILLKKILTTSTTLQHSTKGHSSRRHRSLQCPASMARARQQRRIDHDNTILAKRLQAAKPSKDIEDAFAESGKVLEGRS